VVLTIQSGLYACIMQPAVWMQAAHEVVALAGFHIKRQEFEPEYDNEAEMIVADMEFRDDDTEVGLHACTPLSHHDVVAVVTIIITTIIDIITIIVVIIVVLMNFITVIVNFALAIIPFQQLGLHAPSLALMFLSSHVH